MSTRDQYDPVVRTLSRARDRETRDDGFRPGLEIRGAGQFDRPEPNRIIGGGDVDRVVMVASPAESEQQPQVLAGVGIDESITVWIVTMQDEGTIDAVAARVRRFVAQEIRQSIQ